MFDQNESIDITRDLLIALGIEIQKDTNTLVYQSNHSQISESGKFVKANTDPNKALYISEYDVKLEPLNPKCTKLMERLFAKFLEDSAEDECIPEVLVYFFDKDEDTHKYRLTIKFEDGTSYVGNWYFNKIIGYNEAIFNIDGTFANKDLRPYDIEQEDDYANQDSV